MENELQVGVGEAQLVQSRVLEWGRAAAGEARATHRCRHKLFLVGLVPLAPPCQLPGCQVCPGPAIPKLPAGCHSHPWMLWFSARTDAVSGSRPFKTGHESVNWGGVGGGFSLVKPLKEGLNVAGRFLPRALGRG